MSFNYIDNFFWRVAFSKNWFKIYFFYFNIPAINIGERQINRFGVNKVINTSFNSVNIIKAIKTIKRKKINFKPIFGKGDSSKKIINIIKTNKFKKLHIQKLYKNLK